MVTSGAEEDRTPDLLNAIQTRSQLRYSPTLLRFYHTRGSSASPLRREPRRVFRRMNDFAGAPPQSEPRRFTDP